MFPLLSGVTGVIGKDRICGVVAATDARSMWGQLRQALHSSRTAELRLDWLVDDYQIQRFLGQLSGTKIATRLGATLIATCRRRGAGGRYRGSIAKQLLHLAEALRAGCSWYDLEIESIRECLPELLDVLLGEGRMLASAHFFDRLPRNLNLVDKELNRSGANAIKVAAQCDSLAQGLKVLRLARGRRNVVAIPMGDAVLPLRLLALREGSAISYAPVENATAQGQVLLPEVKSRYRADRLNRRTRVYGIVGNPVAQSLSPLMQNAAFQARRMNAVYLPFLVGDLRDFLRAIKPIGIAGFSVTIPHKQAILSHLDGCDPLAAAIGAVNTVVVRGGGRLYGYNTDYIGVLRALEPRIPLRASRVLIVGAGGAARAAAFALTRAGAAVCVCSRRPKTAAALAKAVSGYAIPHSRLRNEFFDAIVNATPVGMHPRTQDSPLDRSHLNCRLIFDTIYRPRETRLLQMAAARGIETVSGFEMFVAQGTAQFEIWTGKRAPADVMRKAAMSALQREERVQNRE